MVDAVIEEEAAVCGNTGRFWPRKEIAKLQVEATPAMDTKIRTIWS